MHDSASMAICEQGGCFSTRSMMALCVDRRYAERLGRVTCRACTQPGRLDFFDSKSGSLHLRVGLVEVWLGMIVDTEI